MKSQCIHIWKVYVKVVSAHTIQFLGRTDVTMVLLFSETEERKQKYFLDSILCPQ